MDMEFECRTSLVLLMDGWQTIADFSLRGEGETS
jgi:hypothetical protein